MTTASLLLPQTAPATIAAYLDAGLVSAADVSAAATLVDIARRDNPTIEPDLRAWLAMCLALQAPRDGHTCVSLDAIDDWRGDLDPARAATLEWTTDKDTWLASLATAGKLVGEPGDRAPFICDGARLYVARSLHEEREIARLLLSAGKRLEILLGGPGTGKTTAVARRLVDLLRDDPQMRIALAAPTGKAAARMAEALQQRLHDERAPDEVRNASPAVRAAIAAAHPTTIHELLGVRPNGTPRYTFRAENRLAYKLVVIDEVSMLSSSLMYHLLNALDDQTQLLLVGDPNQLASVDAGSVLGDMARAAVQPGSPLNTRTDTLTIRHRFGPRIGGLADAILKGADGVAEAFEILEDRWTYEPDANNQTADDPTSVRWVQPGTGAFRKLVEEVVSHSQHLRALAKAGETQRAVESLRDLQVLTAHREGALGVAGWNTLVQRRMGFAGGSQWYSGRPVLVTKNNKSLGLHNGDVGVVVPASGERRKLAAFPQGKSFRLVPVSRLESIETVHALTVHKSQGSEYKHVIVVLPDKPSRIVTQELLYTGVTRGIDSVTVVGSREVIEAAIRKPIRRATGLEEQLRGG